MFVAFAIHFYHSLVVQKCETSIQDMEQLESMKRDLDTATVKVNMCWARLWQPYDQGQHVLSGLRRRTVKVNLLTSAALRSRSAALRSWSTKCWAEFASAAIKSTCAERNLGWPTGKVNSGELNLKLITVAQSSIDTLIWHCLSRFFSCKLC